jgi:hypothetical protein
MESDGAGGAGGLSHLALAWAAVIAWVVVANDAEELEELHAYPWDHGSCPRTAGDLS